MQTVLGKSILEQIAVGRLSFYHRFMPPPPVYTQYHWRQELGRFYWAQQSAIVDLEQLYSRALAQVGEGVASIFKIHILLLEDQDYMSSIRALIQERNITAEHAVELVELTFSTIFSDMDNPYMKARAADIRDISHHMLHTLMGSRPRLTMEAPAILVSDSFLPSDVMAFDRQHLLGLIAQKGSLNSHTAMLLRAYHIPTIVEADLSQQWEGHLALMDGYTGTIYLDPQPSQQDSLRMRYQAMGCPVPYPSLAASAKG